jgi:hypothetical protein
MKKQKPNVPVKRNEPIITPEIKHVTKTAWPVIILVLLIGIISLVTASIMNEVGVSHLVDILARTILRIFNVVKT